MSVKKGQRVTVGNRNALALAILLALPTGAALAQETAPAPAESEATTLDAVQVTATRRIENIQDVPMAITTVDAEKLNVLGSGGGDIRFLSGRLPSLNIESSFGRAFPRFYIRGLGNTDFDLNASQPVSLVYDEVVQENPILKGFPVFDLEQVEMLRGPQGTLFGRNTPAGVVKFESVKPAQETSGYGQVSFAELGTLNFEGAFGGGLSEHWSARIAAKYQKRDDWVDNTVPNAPEDELEGYEEMAARAQLLYDNNAGFSALFNLHARDLGGTARLFRANIIAPGTNDLVAGFDPEQVSIDGSNFQKLDSQGGSARLSWDLDRVTLYSITGYETVEALSRGDIDGGFGGAFTIPPFGPGFIPFDAESADGLRDHSQFTQEFRVESNDWGRFDWQAGLFWFDEEFTVDSFNYSTTFGAGAQNGNAVQRQQNQAWAVFGSGDYEVTDAFKLTAGLRYTRDEKDFVAERFDSPIDFLGASETLGPIFANPRDSHVSWDLAGVWTLNDDVNVYARVAEGFRAPSIQGRLLFGDVVSVADTETALSFEVGVKADMYDDRARVAFNLFRYTVDDQQLTAVGGGTNFNTLINADQVVGQGFELDLSAYLTDQLLVTVGTSYNDTEIRDADLTTQICGGGCTVTDDTIVVGGNTLALIDGNALPQAPEWVHNLTARYGIPMGENGELYFFTDWAYRSEVNFFLYESVEFTGQSLVEGGLRVGYTWDLGKYDVALFGRNITDETVVVGGIDFNNLTGFINEPRIWGVEFKASF